MRVYLVDDQTLVRIGLRALLGELDGVQVVGDCGDPRAAMAEITALAPDVVFLDITMPGLSGLDAIASVRAACAGVKVVMMTHHEGDAFVERALRAGADGYLSKDSEPGEIALALRSVMAGRPYVTPKVQGGLVTRVRASADEPAAAGCLQALSEREREVFLLLARGLSNKEVARQLHIATPTVKKHRESLQRKLGVRSQAELARLAVREGLMEA